MFVDRIKLTAHGGKGGQGCVSFHRTKRNPRGKPDGGNGGPGGNVILRVDTNVATLEDYFYQPSCRAERGGNGGSQNKNGAAGENVYVRIPPGTVVTDAESGECIADMIHHGQEYVIARGGRGGYGNLHFKSSTNRGPRNAEPGEEGQTTVVLLELKLIADIGLVGFPNAGKSSLVNALTHTHSLTAAYPFTTRTPVLGIMELPNYERAVIADIPGIIEGAHNNVGLGHDFLRHIERCRILFYVIDMAAVDQRNPIDDLTILMKELDAYDPTLNSRATHVIANKADLPEFAAHFEEFSHAFPHMPCIITSAINATGLDDIKQVCADKMHRMRLNE